MGYNSVLIPTDGSDAADQAMGHALSLATEFDAEVHALSVLDLQQAAGPFDVGGLEPSFVERLQEQADDDIQDVADRWTQPDRFHGTVEEGAPSKAILDYVREHDIDLVAMGTHGRTGLRRFVLGSVTEHVLRESPVPVLATRATESTPTLPYRNVLVPTDGSDRATAAVEHALSIALTCDARLHVLNVVDEAAVVDSPGGALPSNYIETLEAMGEEETKTLAQRIREQGIDAETAVERGRPATAIDSYAKDADIDLIVMGTHGRSGVERFLLGSTTEQVIRNGTTPVLAVPGENTAETEN